jgi:hypothetical protein
MFDISDKEITARAFRCPDCGQDWLEYSEPYIADSDGKLPRIICDNRWSPAQKPHEDLRDCIRHLRDRIENHGHTYLNEDWD